MQNTVPMVADQLTFLQLPTGDFIKVDLRANANGDWTIEHLDSTGAFVAGLQVAAPAAD